MSNAALTGRQLSLPRWPLAEARSLITGDPSPRSSRRLWHPEYPMSETVTSLAMAWAAHRAHGWLADREPPWWVHQITVHGVVVGDAGFHGPPPKTSPSGRMPLPVVVEIGYNVVPSWRGRGVATQACVRLLTWAWRHGADRVEAETPADHQKSRAVLGRAGFWREDRLDSAVHRFVAERPSR